MDDDLFQALGLAHLSDQEKEKMQEQLGGVVLERVLNRGEALLKRRDRKAFNRLRRTDSAGAYEMLERNLPTFSAIVQEEANRIRADMTDTHAAVMKKLGY